MHKRQKQFNSSGIKWPIGVDMLFNKTQTQILDETVWISHHSNTFKKGMNLTMLPLAMGK